MILGLGGVDVGLGSVDVNFDCRSNGVDVGVMVFLVMIYSAQVMVG